MKRVLVFDSADGYLFDLDPSTLLSIVVTEEINGVNALDISTAQRLEKSQRILVPSATGDWQEYVVINDSATHEAGDRQAYGTYRAVWSVQYDLMTVYGPDVESGGETDVGPSSAIQNALNGTSRWAVGTVTASGEATIEMFGNSAWERLQDVVKVYGGELRQRVTVGFNKVTARYVDLLARMGSDMPTRRFEWKRDVTDISRKASESPLFSRIIPIGKSDEVTIEDVNDGVRWLNDPDADLAYRVPDGHGGWEYPTQKVKFSDIDDDRELLAYANAHITDYTRPVPTYEASVLQYAAAGMDYTGVALGDVVQIVDLGFSEDVPLRLEGRVHKIVRNLMDETDVTLTIGDVSESFSLSLQRMDKTISTVKNSLDVTFGGSLTSTGQYVEWLTDQMNNYINAIGGWTYIVQGRGLVTYSVEVSDPNEGAEAKAAVATGNGAVTEIRGGTIRIANSLTPSGDWDYKTVFLSGHIAAELVTAAQITAGFIGNAPNGSYWNLDTGELRISGTSTLGDRTVNSALGGIDAANSYLSFSPSTGLDVGYAGTDMKTRIDGNSVQLVHGNTVLFHVGYDNVAYPEYSAPGPFFTLGNRVSLLTVGAYSMALGEDCAATDAYAFAHGVNSTADGYCSYAGGGDTYAGHCSHAEGSHTVASGNYSHAENLDTVASGWNSHAEGFGSEASGNNSHAAGLYTIAAGESQTVIGEYNVADSNTLPEYRKMLLVGGGSSDSRKSILVLSRTGDMTITGRLTQNSDKRLKEHHAYLGDDASEFIRKLRPALYTKDGSKHVGFYAQDVLAADKWETAMVVSEHNEEGLGFDPLTLDYNAIIAPLVAYCQQLEQKVTDLEAKVDTLTKGGCS